MTENNLFSAEINFNVKPYDIDAAGHVNNAVYFKWLEDLRVKLFENFLPVNELLKRNQYLVVTSANIKYKRQISLEDKPSGTMRLERIDRIIWVLKAEFTVNNFIASAAEQKCVVVDLINNIIQKPSAELVQKFKSQSN